MIGISTLKVESYLNQSAYHAVFKDIYPVLCTSHASFLKTAVFLVAIGKPRPDMYTFNYH